MKYRFLSSIDFFIFTSRKITLNKNLIFFKISIIFVFKTKLWYYKVNKNEILKMNKYTNIDRKELSKEIREKYKEMWELFWNNYIEERIFTDKFLEIYEQVQIKVLVLLSGSKTLNEEKISENIEKLFQDSFNKAILSIININTRNTQEVWYSIFKPKSKLKLKWKSNWNIEFREWEKHEEFLKIYNELFFWRKDTEIHIYKESLDIKRMRKSPYHIINIKWKNFSKTILISNQIWEATYIYDSLIEPEQFREIEKWQEIDWVKPIKVAYRNDYSNRLKDILSWNNDFSILDENLSQEEIEISEQDYFYQMYLKTIFTSITDKDWTELKVDLKSIWLRDFSKNLYFWHDTKYTKVSWRTLLRKTLLSDWWENNFTLKKVLEKWGIVRDDLPLEKIDYKNNQHIIEIFKKVTDKDWNNLEVSLKATNVSEFRDLYFWYWTKYWMISWRTLLIDNWWHNNRALKKILKLWWIL